MSFESALSMLKTMQKNTNNIPVVMANKANHLSSFSRLKNVAVVVSNKPNGATIVFKPMVGAMVETEHMTKTAKALSAKLALDSKTIVKGAL